MLRDTYKKNFIKIESIYFSNKIVNSNADIIKYFQASLIFSDKKRNFLSNIIELKNKASDIKSNFRKSLINEINQAEKKYKIKAIFEESPSNNQIEEFILFFNNFAMNKNIPFADENKLKRIKANLIFTKASFDEKVIVWHAYMHDDFRFRLVYSSNILNKDKELKKIIVRGNKFLHYQDIIYAKKKGFAIYDMGGISGSSKELIGIDEFKLSFSKKLESTLNCTIANNIKGKIILNIYRNLLVFKRFLKKFIN